MKIEKLIVFLISTISQNHSGVYNSGAECPIIYQFYIDKI